MKRAGFTMIELIFVIVILGILAAVAVPKLVGVKEQAEEGNVKSFVGTLNRTIGASKWSKSIFDGHNGGIKAGHDGDATAYDITLADTEFPQDGYTTVTVANCEDSTALARSATVAASGTTFDIVCRDGNSTTAPKFWYAPKDGNATALFSDTSLKL
jgi:prepilin-type N-terminal cleavage/methylation domain-containing protein